MELSLHDTAPFEVSSKPQAFFSILLFCFFMFVFEMSQICVPAVLVTTYEMGDKDSSTRGLACRHGRLLHGKTKAAQSVLDKP